MVQIQILKELSQLKESGFGQPLPRHGLRLLWWFARECVQINSNHRMTARCNPAKGEFGFHRFHNRTEVNAEKLLPNTKLTYYEVGNLNTLNAALLPHYVTENYTGKTDDSNTDRIIISFDKNLNRFDSIYVTQHSDKLHFDHNCTYQISQGLIKVIKSLGLEELEEAVNKQRSDSESSLQSESISDEESSDFRPLLTIDKESSEFRQPLFSDEESSDFRSLSRRVHRPSTPEKCCSPKCCCVS
ncbi:uncharacterized protein LOC127444064 [Myxocyprinus asiaticus]|uniref:uncharacterized protein LOC127444064 n=1 Tax=Myxocyprinus asiaticus TaxID=70543 RepID=UPI0022213772|nr:uncharacterized protein LOC127444064 [Myxocyprinus asiaticus]